MDDLKQIQSGKSDTPFLSQYHDIDIKLDCSTQLCAGKCPTAGLLQEEVCWQYPDLKKIDFLPTETMQRLRYFECRAERDSQWNHAIQNSYSYKTHNTMP